MPKYMVQNLSMQVSAIIQWPGFGERLAGMWFEPVGNTSEEFARFLAQDCVRGANLVGISGARFE